MLLPLLLLYRQVDDKVSCKIKSKVICAGFGPEWWMVKRYYSSIVVLFVKVDGCMEGNEHSRKASLE